MAHCFGLIGWAVCTITYCVLIRFMFSPWYNQACDRLFGRHHKWSRHVVTRCMLLLTAGMLIRIPWEVSMKWATNWI